MRMRLLLVGLAVVVGCQKATPLPPSTTTQSTADSFGTPPPTSEPDINSSKEEAALLARLAENANDSQALLGLARINHVNARETRDDDYKLAKKAADYLHRAIEADPTAARNFTYEFVGKAIFYNEAQAFAHEKNDEASLKSLRQAVDAGWDDIRKIKTDPELEQVRQNPEFAHIEEALQAAAKKKAIERIELLFGVKHKFKFDFNLEDTEGQPLTKQQYAGKVLMVNIWGTWCVPCRREIPDLIAAAIQYKNMGFEIVGINTERETGDAAIKVIQSSIKQLEINYPCALANQETLGQIPNLGGVPTSIFFNRQGEIQAVYPGMITRDTLELIIERLLMDSPQ